MIKVESNSNTEAKTNENSEALMQWQKPEAKIAEVATATLAGHQQNNRADLGTCAS